MKRAAALTLALVLASCGGSPSTSVQPETLAMADESEAFPDTAATLAETDLMVFEIAGERFELVSGICNTYEDGTFRFALGEGAVGSSGRVTATIERFNTGVGYELIVAFEGQRDDATALRWYARDDVAVHDVVVSVFGPSVSGSAQFTSSNESLPTTETVAGSFAITCS